MTLEVIGAGLGRTGTTSLCKALEILDFQPCYHMDEAERRPDHDDPWLAAANGSSPDFDALFGGYKAAVDWPTVTHYRALAHHYPNARFVLTVRDTDGWVRSMMQTILPTVIAPPSPTVRPKHRQMTRQLIAENLFGGRVDDPDHAARLYEEHNDSVRAFLPPEQLVVLPLGAGWAPLCEFLGRPIPSCPYPDANSATDFNRIPRDL